MSENIVTSGLNYKYEEKHEWYDAMKNYTDCYSRYFSIFNKRNLLVKEAARPDINLVCLKELKALRGATGKIDYKQINGGVIDDNTWIFD
jgi:hypothetical protein